MTNYFRALYYLESLNRQAFLERKKTDALRNRRLKTIIRYAYNNSPFYNNWLKTVGIRPEEIKSVEDLNRVPVVRKNSLAQNPKDFLSKEYDSSKLKTSFTSGSTGQPRMIYMSEAENEYRKAKHLRAQMALGQKPWDKWVTITTPGHFAETTYLQRAFRIFGITALSVFDDVRGYISKLVCLQPDVIDGFSSSILLLAKEVQNRGADLIKPRFLVSGADLIDAHSRRLIEEVFEAPLYDQYAAIEFERVAWQCQEKDEYHIDADTLIVQFLDDDGNEVSPGERGEVVVTSLFNRAMPLIRFSLDDVCVPSEKDECACGRTLPLMKVIEGRKCMLVTLPSGRVLAPLAFTASVLKFKSFDLIDLFRIVQKRKDLIVFKLKLKNPDLRTRNLESEFVNHVRKTLALSEDEVDIQVESVDEMQIDKNGKFQLITSEI